MRVSFRSVRNGILVALLLLVPLALLRTSVQNRYQMSAFDRAVWRIGAPLEAGITYSARWLSSFFERWVFQARALEQREQLEQENRVYRRRLADLQRLEEENRELRRSLQLRDNVPEDLLAAEVVGVEQSPFFRVVKIAIDRGADFLRPEMAVLSADGIVGRIEKAHDERSHVVLITDPASHIAVEIARTKAPGILQGMGEDRCQVEIVSEKPVAEGDLIQTSGADDLFPKGHPVGRVVRVDRKIDEGGEVQVVEVVPTVRFDHLRMVWVVLATAPDPDPEAGTQRRPKAGMGVQPVQ
ncbi:MAG: rod shape-determining protein MreC [Myxococcales bacterium FL481]|nr:MAG: rod shape-determining protein MreC [Myxococcales bacterium FL481]